MACDSPYMGFPYTVATYENAALSPDSRSSRVGFLSGSRDARERLTVYRPICRAKRRRKETMVDIEATDNLEEAESLLHGASQMLQALAAEPDS